MPWARFVVLGDSLTEGVGDPMPGGLRGWADRLAEGLRAVEPALFYANIAYRGLTTREVIDSQLDRVLEMRPDLTSAVVGMNDLIDPGFERESYARDLDSLVEPLCASGATVLTATYPDVTLHLRVPRRAKERLRARLLVANEVVREVSSAHGTLLVDADHLVEQSSDVGSFSIDRLHPGPLGHLLIARAFAALLGARAGRTIPLPDPKDGRHGAGKLGQARWIVSQMSPLDVARFVARLRANR